jgi:O-acetyl-ADP-ribose deacetylase (regulator of RNase III)
VAFPAISTGIYGYPANRAAQVACAVVTAELTAHRLPATVILVAYDDEAEGVLRAALEMCTPLPAA